MNIFSNLNTLTIQILLKLENKIATTISWLRQGATISHPPSSIRTARSGGSGRLVSRIRIGTFFDNAAYLAYGPWLYRIELDGAFTLLGNYSDRGVSYFHHNIDRGKVGIILDANTTSFFESMNIEVDASGNILKTWNLAAIISAAMRAGETIPASSFIRRQTTGSITTPWLTTGRTTL